MTDDELYRVVIIILYDGDSILLQQRSDDAAYLPGCWAYFGGGIEPGELPLDAVIRETMEEVSYRLNKPALLLEQRFSIHDQPAYMYVFMEELRGDRSLLALHEGKDWGWFRRSEIGSLGMLARDEAIAMAAFETIAVKGTGMNTAKRENEPCPCKQGVGG